MILQSRHEHGNISVYTHKLGAAELSNLGEYITVEGLDNPVYYFNRIKVKPQDEGKGYGRELMIEVCKIADEHGITILNELNPYGKRDLDSLKEFFKASGFEEFNMENVMVRKPKGITMSIKRSKELPEIPKKKLDEWSKKVNKNIGEEFDLRKILESRSKKENPYHGISWIKSDDEDEQNRIIKAWKLTGNCKDGFHLFDEVWNGSDHYLNCDVCDLVVNISSIDTQYTKDWKKNENNKG